MKKLLTALLAIATVLSLSACGNSQSESTSETSISSTRAALTNSQSNTESDNTTVSLSDYNGIYTNNDNGETITIGDEKIVFDGTSLTVESIADDYFILVGSSAIFIMQENCIITNLSHPDDNSYLDTYIKEIAPLVEESTDAIPEEPPVSESSTSQAPISEEDGFDDVTPISLKIAGDSIALPITAEALTGLGWSYSGGSNGRYTKGECYFFAYNGIEYAQEGQLVTGLKTARSCLAGEDLSFSNGISFESSLSDIRTIYGTETTTYESEQTNVYEFVLERLKLQFEIANVTVGGLEKGKLDSVLIQLESKYARDPNTGEYKYVN